MEKILVKTSALTVLILSSLSTLNAQENPQDNHSDNDWHGFVSAGAILAPDFEGSKDYKVLPFPSFHIRKGNYYIQTEGAGFAVNVINDANFNAGPLIAYRPDRDDVHSPLVQSLTPIDDAIEVGGFMSYGIDTSRPGERIEAKIKGVFDIGDAYDGYSLTANIAYRTMFKQKFMFNVDVSATWADKNYTNTYFGVNAADSLASNLEQYAPKGGFKDVGINTSLNYQFKDNWGVMGILGYSHLLDVAKKSPIIQAVGSTSQMHGGLALTYSF